MYIVHVHVHVCLLMKEPDTKQRRTGVQLLHSRDSAVARPRALVEAVAGGQCLAALLVHYHHQEFSFQGTCLCSCREIHVLHA